MMVDFAIDAERDEGLSTGGGDPQGGAAALPADHDDHHGRAARRRAADARATAPARNCASRSAIAMVGGLVVSQALTLFTTPVVYLYLDRLAQLLSGSKRPRRAVAKVDAPAPPAPQWARMKHSAK